MYIRSYAVQCKKEMFSENRYRLICFLFESVVKVNDVFIDIGANIGLCSAAALRTPDVQLIAVEPGTQFRNILKRNLSAITTAERANILTHPNIPFASQKTILSQFERQQINPKNGQNVWRSFYPSLLFLNELLFE